ncbi:scavenger receptor cysteine-rich domain-containing protein DMBT1-like isoform X2 [Amphiura filiformis]|uniref:scavenger receptor cysteine-rich domain-containing protein DMBT1-like isoform X2 n=1 Tax=Amphiura filiformis TaxID=82378 RepID=UPI003B20BF85
MINNIYVLLISLMFCDVAQCQLGITPSSAGNTGLRLQGGPDSYEGLVQVWLGNQWVSICAEGWDLQDAHVACQQLGFQQASEIISGDLYGNGGNNSVWIRDVDCRGTEESLQECNYSVSDVSCQQDGAVICASEIEIRLVDGEDVLYSGRLEILYRGQWGTVCHDDWDDMDARVICQMLGAPGVMSSLTFYGTGNGPIWLDNVMCNGDEESIADCKFPDWGKHDCSHQHDVGLSCRDVRLVDGSSILEGRVDIHYGGSWGSVCDNQWDIQDADVVCKQLGFKSAFKATGAAAFGEGTGDIFLDSVQCSGTEDALRDCYNRGWGQHMFCKHSQDAGVICDEVRLVGGGGDFEGRLEIFHNNQWGTVCNDAWDFQDAKIVCQQLGYEDALEANIGITRFGEGTGPIWLDEVTCNGDEQRLVECGRAMWGDNDCNHSEDVGIVCVTGPTLRLERGSQASGRVEIFYEGTWGTVCDFQWDVADAVVVCQYLGFPGASWATSGGNYGQGIGPVWMSGVQCNGQETRLQDCPQPQPWGENECDHTQDAGVVCVPVIPDTEPPEITDCPTTIFTTVYDRSSQDVSVSWRQPIATDNSGEIPSVTISHPPGSVFPIGFTIVTYTFMDPAGNQAECNFEVIVEALPPTTSTELPPTTSHITTATEEYSTYASGSSINLTTSLGSTSIATGSSTFDMSLVLYLGVPMVLSVSLVIIVAVCVLCLCRRTKRKQNQSHTESQKGLFLAADVPSPTTLQFEMMSPYSVSARTTMEGRQLPSQPSSHLYDPDPPDAEIDHEYDDADSGHYEALPPIRDEHGYLIMYADPTRDPEGYLVPDKRLSAISSISGTSAKENLVVYSERPDTPQTEPVMLSFQNAGYESTLGKTGVQIATQPRQTEQERKDSKGKKKRNFKLKEKRASKQHPSLKRTLTAP